MIPGRPATKGRLLLATPPLDDPNFDRTVIYVVEHHDDGALGIVLNRPSDEQLEEPLDRWNDLLSSPSGVFAGGPVETEALIAIAQVSGNVDDEENLSPVSGDIVSANLAVDPMLVAGAISRLRVYRGYSGWSPGQLEVEIEAGAWIVLDTIDSDLFAQNPADLWRTILRRQPGRLSWLADAPDDLTAN